MINSNSTILAAEFNQRLFDVAKRLANKNLVVSEIHCDWGGFGSWWIQVQRGKSADQYSEALLNHDYDSWGPEVLRLLWDGRDGLLAVSSSPTPPISGPSRWKELEAK